MIHTIPTIHQTIQLTISDGYRMNVGMQFEHGIVLIKIITNLNNVRGTSQRKA